MIQAISYYNNLIKSFININPLASPCAGATALNYGYVNIVTPSPGEVKGLINFKIFTYKLYI